MSCGDEGLPVPVPASPVHELLGDFSGWLVVDGLSTYPAVRDLRVERWRHNDRDGPEPFEIAGCWAHARRKFFNAAKNWPAADEMLDYIALLYRLFEGAEECEVDDATRTEWLEQVFSTMRTWMHNQRPVPNSSLTQAIGYTDRFWERLTKIAEHRELWLDNNPSERALRSVVLGRKNHYGSKSSTGMKAAAIFYSLIETCELLGISARDYLTMALTRAIEAPGSVYLPHDFVDEFGESST